MVGAKSLQTRGPIPEFPAKKAAVRELQTRAWYRYSPMQLWAFLKEHELTRIGQRDELARPGVLDRA
jgi:hypothetical protein